MQKLFRIYSPTLTSEEKTLITEKFPSKHSLWRTLVPTIGYEGLKFETSALSTFYGG